MLIHSEACNHVFGSIIGGRVFTTLNILWDYYPFKKKTIQLNVAKVFFLFVTLFLCCCYWHYSLPLKDQSGTYLACDWRERGILSGSRMGSYRWRIRRKVERGVGSKGLRKAGWKHLSWVMAVHIWRCRRDEVDVAGDGGPVASPLLSRHLRRPSFVLFLLSSPCVFPPTNNYLCWL